MFRFFVKPEQITGDIVTVSGEDVNHMKNVLRMKPGEKVRISNGTDMDYFCMIDELNDDNIILHVYSRENNSIELPVKIYLFQGLPKSDKMELIIQKAVELGVYKIIPVAMKRSVVKLDNKKAVSKVKRWNGISESAAKQSGRMIIPEVTMPVSFKEAIDMAADIDYKLLPYENEEGMQGVRNLMSELAGEVSKLRETQSFDMDSALKVGIFIGPEGGYEPSEVDMAQDDGWKRISLGRRILRTETAGLTCLSIMVYMLEP